MLLRYSFKPRIVPLCLAGLAAGLGLAALSLQSHTFQSLLDTKNQNQLESLVRGIEQGLLLEDDFILEAMIQTEKDGDIIRIEIFGPGGRPLYPPELDASIINDVAKAASRSKEIHTQLEFIGDMSTRAVYMPLQGPQGSLGAAVFHRALDPPSRGGRIPLILILCGAFLPLAYALFMGLERRSSQQLTSPIMEPLGETRAAESSGPIPQQLVSNQGAQVLFSDNRVIHSWGDFSKFMDARPVPGEHIAKMGGLNNPKKLEALLGQAPWPDHGIGVHVIGNSHLRLISFFLDDRPD